MKKKELKNITIAKQIKNNRQKRQCFDNENG